MGSMCLTESHIIFFQRCDVRNANGGIKTSDRDGGIEMVEVPIHSAPGEMEPGQNGGLKMKRYDVLISTMISNYSSGVTSKLQEAAHHQ